jgi:hypothetical protein
MKRRHVLLFLSKTVELGLQILNEQSEFSNLRQKSNYRQPVLIV